MDLELAQLFATGRSAVPRFFPETLLGGSSQLDDPLSIHVRLEEIIQTIRSLKDRDQGKQESNRGAIPCTPLVNQHRP